MSVIKKDKGFSLFELMLVIAIMAAIAALALRMQQHKFEQAKVDRAAAQVNQIFAAATSYYIDNGKWPGEAEKNGIQPQNILDLTTKNAYLPSSFLNGPDQQSLISPFGTPYSMGVETSPGSGGTKVNAQFFYVRIPVENMQQLTELRNKLPTSLINNTTGDYYVSAFISIPSYDYNHAKTVSDVGVYHPGDCVPRPSFSCPKNMKSATFVSLEQGYGLTDSTSQTVYPIVGFSGYAIKPVDGQFPKGCPGMASGGSYPDPNAPDGSGTHWVNPQTTNQCAEGDSRVCAQFTTTQGPLSFNSTNSDTLKNTVGNTYLLVITKCVPDPTS